MVNFETLKLLEVINTLAKQTTQRGFVDWKDIPSYTFEQYRNDDYDDYHDAVIYDSGNKLYETEDEIVYPIVLDYILCEHHDIISFYPNKGEIYSDFTEYVIEAFKDKKHPDDMYIIIEGFDKTSDVSHQICIENGRWYFV